MHWGGTVDRKEIYANISELEEQMGTLYSDLGKLKEKMISLLEENQRVNLENERLRKMLKQPDSDEPADRLSEGKPSIGEGHDNLARLYNEGFHICNVYYGHLRIEGDCLFCLSFLSK